MNHWISCPTWPHFIQDKLKISIYLSLGKYKCIKLSYTILYFILWLIITSSHLALKTVGILISSLLQEAADLDLHFLQEKPADQDLHCLQEKPADQDPYCLQELISDLGDFKNNASISLIIVYRLSKADLLLKLILRYVINVFLASCQVSLL